MGNIVTTYIGATNIISALGFTTKENVTNVCAGVVGIKPYSKGIIAAAIDKDRLCKAVGCYSLEEYLPLEQLMILSVKDVIEQSGVNLNSSECAIIFSTTKGNINLLSQNNNLEDDRIYLWKMAQRVANYFNAVNEPIVISNACISGVSATIVASRLISNGAYKNIIVVGGDILTDFVISGFSSFKSLSSTPCKPYDIQRNGLTLGEACASMLITSNNALSGGVVIEGGAITNDANHISGPSRSGDGLAYAIKEAMNQSNVEQHNISFINAHGTATLFNDEMESKAITLCGLQNTPVTSLKPYFGHTLGASGVVETIMCAQQLKMGVLFGTLGFTTLGVPAPIVVLGKNTVIDMKRCVKTASGFGGCNAAIVLACAEYSKNINSVAEEVTYRKIAQHSISSVCNFNEYIRAEFKALETPNIKFYKMDDLCKLGYVTAEYLLKGYKYKPLDLAIVLSNKSSSLDTDLKHQEILNKHNEEGTSPAVFVYTLPNVVLGEICIRHKIQGENTFFINSKIPKEFLEKYAKIVLAQSGCKAIIYGWCEKIGERYSSQMILMEK
ncbi:MAG: beta-ketoacyl synthase N-terminal-like domain-containing protein [Bacteroidales bacterium]